MEIVKPNHLGASSAPSGSARRRRVFRLALLLFYSGLMVTVGAALHKNAFFCRLGNALSPCFGSLACKLD